MLSELVNTPSVKCPNVSISDQMRNQMRTYRYCELPANLSTVNQVITLYEDSIKQVIDLLILAKNDVHNIRMNASLWPPCPYGATVYDACADGM